MPCGRAAPRIIFLLQQPPDLQERTSPSLGKKSEFENSNLSHSSPQFLNYLDPGHFETSINHPETTFMKPTRDEDVS